MPGYSEMREVAIWLQTAGPAKAQIRFWDAKKPQQKRNSEELFSKKGDGYTLTFTIDSLQAGKEYQYEVWVNDKKQEFSYPLRFQTSPLWQFRSDPPNFSVAVGSCAYVNEPEWDRPGKGYGDSMEIFRTIARQKPDLMLWIGDNTYTREGDWNTKTGFYHRYSHTRALPEMQELLAVSHHYATWDDHDYGPNDADRSFWNKNMAAEIFRKFWPMPPGYSMGEGAVTSTFSWGDCQFFMLDNRWFRAPNADKDSTKAYLGEEQIKWLLDALTFSKATFKIISCGGQVLNPAGVYENYAAYPVERRSLLKRITDARIPGVLFLSGDRHHAELTKMERPGTYPLYDLTTSPLTAGVHNPGNEANYLRVPGTLFNGHNFALLKFSGPAKARLMNMQVLNNKGQVVWQQEIKASDLK